MAEYDYPGTMIWPDLDALEPAVVASAMTDKALEGATWDEDTDLLRVYFTNELSGGDKTLLDGIVAALPPEDA